MLSLPGDWSMPLLLRVPNSLTAVRAEPAFGTFSNSVLPAMSTTVSVRSNVLLDLAVTPESPVATTLPATRVVAVDWKSLTATAAPWPRFLPGATASLVADTRKSFSLSVTKVTCLPETDAPWASVTFDVDTPLP